jgi:hypothetical protein
MLFAHDICPYRVGSRVRVAETNEYAKEWPGIYVVTCIRWEFQKGDGTAINISIASDLELQAKNGDTDGWSSDDLLPA